MKNLYIIILIALIWILLINIYKGDYDEHFQTNDYVADELAYISKPFEIKDKYNSVIPLKLYQTWCTKNLPQYMEENVNKLKADNPEFEYFLFDNDDCRNFIRDNFPNTVLHAFDSLIPGAYKADLWRYCVLYINGGVYLDIKYKCINGFKLIALTEKEHFCNDWSEKTILTDICCDEGIYNAIMVCKPKNEILLKAINQIVSNVQNNFYGINPLDPTGPYLLRQYFDEDSRKKFELNFYKRAYGKLYIRHGLFVILEEYPQYRSELKNFSNSEHYDSAWRRFNIYKN